MARLLAERDGIHVTVAISPVGAERIRSCFIEPVAAAKLPISFVDLPFPCAEAGLPDGVETIEQIQDPSLFPKMHVAAGLLRKPLESILRELPRKPSVILADLYHPWAREVAADLGVPLLLYYVFPCFTILVYRSLRQHGIYDDGAADASRMFPVPDAPEYMVSRAQAPGTFDRPGWEWLREEAIAAESAAAGVIFHSFDQLEPNFLPKFQEIMGGLKTWAIGPLSLSHKNVLAERGSANEVAADSCLTWLDANAPASVIYVCFGTNTYWTPQQIIEVGSGIESSGHPFIWVLKKRELTPEVEEFLSGEFEERVQDRGLLIRGWAPQAAILTHKSIGGFMTHGGWNSSIEGVAAGVPMLTWPHFEDQFLHQMIIVQVLGMGIGVGVRAQEDYIRAGDGHHQAGAGREGGEGADGRRGGSRREEEEGEGVRGEGEECHGGRGVVVREPDRSDRLRSVRRRHREWWR
nr:UDP-glycosyltransferase [Paris polyphylla]